MYRSITLPNGAKLLTEFVPAAAEAVRDDAGHDQAVRRGTQENSRFFLSYFTQAGDAALSFFVKTARACP